MKQLNNDRGVPSMGEDDVTQELKEKVWAFFNAEGSQENICLNDINNGIVKIGLRANELVPQWRPKHDFSNNWLTVTKNSLKYLNYVAYHRF